MKSQYGGHFIKSEIYLYVYIYIYISLWVCIYVEVPNGSVVKNLPANAQDASYGGFIPGSGIFPGGGEGNPLQYAYLKNPMGRGAWWTTVAKSYKELQRVTVAKSWTWLSTHAYIYNWMDRSRKVSFARQELWSASLIIWFFLLVNPTFFLWSTWEKIHW